MKTLVSLLLGAVSSALLSIGFVRAASACDPHFRHTSISASANLAATDGCNTACYLIQQDNSSTQA